MRNALTSFAVVCAAACSAPTQTQVDVNVAIRRTGTGVIVAVPEAPEAPRVVISRLPGESLSGDQVVRRGTGPRSAER